MNNFLRGDMRELKEVAMDPKKLNNRATELLLGMGLDAFSMSASSVLQVKKKIRNSSYEKAQKYRDEILALNTPEEVLENLR